MFRGVLCQALADGSNVPLGTFSLMENEAKLKLMQCTAAEDSVTHMNDMDVPSATFMWNPPMGMESEVTIRYDPFCLSLH